MHRVEFAEHKYRAAGVVHTVCTVHRVGRIGLLAPTANLSLAA